MVIVILIIILLVIVGIVTAYYLLNRNKKPDDGNGQVDDKQPDIKGVSQEKPVTVECKDNDISNYVLDEIPLEGSNFLQRISYRISRYLSKEKFTLDSGTISDKTKLNPTTLYRKAKLKSGIKSEISPPLNRGTSCAVYPNEIYVPVEYNLVQFIRLQRITTAPDNVNSINIAEIQVYDLNGNLIPSTISSYSDGGLSGFPSSNVNDGNLNNFAHTNTNIDSSGRNGTIGSYIQVGFNTPVKISRIVITNRKDCCQNRMIGTQIQTYPSHGNTPLTTLNITDTRPEYIIYYSPQSQPIICTGNQVLTSGVCQCPSNLSFNLNNGSCVAPLTCTSNQTQSRDTGVCQCPSNLSFKLNNGSCAAPLTCPSNQTQSRDTGVCQCPSNLSFRLNNGNCVAPLTCTGNQIQNRDTGVCQCRPGETKDSAGVCQCPIKESRDASGVCQCKSGTRDTSGNCVCSYNDLKMDATGNCFNPCGEGSWYSSWNDTCNCNFGYDKVNGVCQFTGNCGPWPYYADWQTRTCQVDYSAFG